MARILVADDEPGVRAFVADALASAGHEVVEAADGEEAFRRLGSEAFELLVTDLQMPRLSGMELLRKVRGARLEVAVIVLTAHGSVAGAVEAVKLGAFDYLEKPVESPAVLRRLAASALAGNGADGAAKAPATPVGDGWSRLTWGAPAMVEVESLLRKVAPTPASVLLLGESGTGKEVAARWVHAHSLRAGGPFVAVNCAALSETLLESDLFGHEKGAFTGAVARKPGKIEAAAGGTFFLDEVGELRPELQTKLLRVLQERCFARVGGTSEVAADVRWIAATNRDLPAEMREGRFREDLYHRLAVFPVRLPPLRERREDLPWLARALLLRAAKDLGRPGLTLDEDALAALAEQEFPGNVRELSNTLARAAILAEGQTLTAADLARATGVSAGGAASARGMGEARGAGAARGAGEARGAEAVEALGSGGRVPTIEELSQAAIRRALEQAGGNRKKAAEQLGIGLRTLYEKLKRYGIR
ncbi:MAG: sigma-54 dependent transcriptional regulator [Polyangiaceae bacterium]